MSREGGNEGLGGVGFPHPPARLVPAFAGMSDAADGKKTSKLLQEFAGHTH